MELTTGEKRIAWAITGAGHKIEECARVLLGSGAVDVFLSRAAEEILTAYNLLNTLSAQTGSIYRSVDASSSVVGRLFGGRYKVLVVAPATSNSVAKFVHGISDTLVTNLFAQAGKSGIPIIVFPTDVVPEVLSSAPGGKSVRVYPRQIDLENTEKLRRFAGVTVVEDVAQLERILALVP